jgi:hypothetical protein
LIHILGVYHPLHAVAMNTICICCMFIAMSRLKVKA